MTTERTPGPLLATLRAAVAAHEAANEAYVADPTDGVESGTDAAFDATFDAVTAARAALLASDEEIPWVLSDDGCDYDTVWASDMDAALAECEATGYDDTTETFWVRHYARSEDLDERGSIRLTVEPEEPKCNDGAEHDWQAPHAIVGGLKENPGVWGNGGGVIIKEVCLICGCGRKTDTWAQDRTTGEQGLESVAYTPGEYAAEIKEAA